jgi:hypothetical protein
VIILNLKEKMKISSKKVYLIIGIVLTIMIGTSYLNSEESPLKEENVNIAYQNFLTKENQIAKKMFGELTIENSKNKLENLKLKKCKETESQKYECIVSVKVNTIRGILESDEKILVSKENNQEIIIQKSILNK